jgi:hypothetical protein
MYLLSVRATYLFLRTVGRLTAQRLISAVPFYLQEYLQAAENNLHLVFSSIQGNRMQAFMWCGQLQQNLVCVRAK